ncbi:Putative arylamine N-acetyltransferase, papain-like cysteine peptidase superfamily [Septoria linicola]|uniref:Arylamine N-acetyltransferase, papain-like cysteine peptidase superfamily n=1 Tax=Septoria linicola TaxID=215465 RepID=A0A9Q9EJL1_9PEZI|nr:putative arylamine N-acetyltransferase, papain-like cysteine peptidase superfamily [Septoria linicola]USW52334.1 Putative arylamine N-acetyltransferase, papain-like cysteine peptidase superfamily [Septoria linicola]
MANRPTFSEEQIHQFYDRIELPQRYRYTPGEESKAVAQGPAGLEILAALQRHTLATVPFENLALHYSRTKIVDIHPELLFQKIVSNNAGRGGYCMETNSLFGAVLRTLGFKLYSTSGRVNSAASPNGEVGDKAMYYGFAHYINIVTIDGMRYHVDVAFGAGGATRPLPLQDGKVHLNMRPSQEVRLRYGSIAETESDTKLWIFERRNRPQDPWSPNYCFLDREEFIPADFEMMNYFTSTSRMTFFTYTILVVKFALSEDQSEIIGETVLYGNRLFKRIAGKKEFDVQLSTESERIEALERDFGIRLNENQQSGILGMVTMLGH